MTIHAVNQIRRWFNNKSFYEFYF